MSVLPPAPRRRGVGARFPLPGKDDESAPSRVPWRRGFSTLLPVPRGRGDLVPVAGLAALAIVDGAGNPTTSPAVVVALLGVLSACILLWRRALPIATPLALGAVIFGRALAGAVPDQTTSTLPMLVVAVASAAVHAPRLRDGLAGGAACLVGTLVAIGMTVKEPLDPLDVIVVSALMAAAGGGGALLRRRTAETRAERERSRAASHARDAESQAAVAEERARIARELHDVLAHSVSIISVQAGAAERLALRDLGRAREAVAQVRRTAEEARGDLVRLLDVLHDDAPGAASSVQPGLGDLERLVTDARDAGLPVALRVDPGLGPVVPDGVALAAFRIVQESLTNVRKHAGAVPTDVRVAHTGEALQIAVANVPGQGRGGGSGLGLVGMDERVRVHGGDLRAGPDPTGRWVVEAVLPIDGRPATLPVPGPAR